MVQYNVPSCFSGDCDCEGTPPPSTFCPYGDCFTCVPSECEGPKCCCCSSIDVVLEIRARCYDRVYFSCNQDGTAPGPNDDPFPPGCGDCLDACARALAGGQGCLSISTDIGNHPIWDPSPADWYTYEGTDIGPCSCDCELFEDATDETSPCLLTCVTCAGLRCNANVDVASTDCSYQFNLTPSTQCCGTPAITDVVFAIDYSGSMEAEIAGVISAVGDFADSLLLTGAQPRFGLLIYGKESRCTIIDSDVIRFAGDDTLTTDVDEFKAAMNVDVSGGSEPDFLAALVALQSYPWEGVENLLFLIGDEPVDNDCPLSGQATTSELIDLANSIGVTIITVQPQLVDDGFDQRKKDLSTNTSGGRDLDITQDFSTLLDDLNLNVFGASCDCLDDTPIPVELCRGGTNEAEDECIDPTTDVPIGICVEEDNSDCTICNEPLTFNVCGEIVVVEPDEDTINLVCCGDLGCSCPEIENPPAGCCGVTCGGGLCPDDDGGYQNLQAAIDGIWCECFNGENTVIETPGCTICTIPDSDDPDYGNYDIDALENCVVKIPDGEGGWTSISRPQIAAEVEAAWAANCVTPDEEPPPPISEADCLPECDRKDECIIGESTCGDQEDIRVCRQSACSAAHVGCTSVRNPSTIVLNNGIGLVAYESMSNNTVIKIDQFNSSLPAKILPNRKTNYGRLQHQLRWEEEGSGFYLGKLYYYDNIPSYFMNGTGQEPTEGTLVDLLVFRSGPFENQCFPIYEEPTGSDDVGNYLQFIIPSDFTLSSAFPSLDDVYNIEWFILDSDDQGLTGSATEADDTPGSDFLLEASDINVALELDAHIHDGKAVPVANPSLAVAHNYMNSIENSHYVYLAYQALEDNKWNVYMRQIRLSEYSREDQLGPSASFRSLAELGISEVVYRVVCTNDSCELFGTDYVAKRSVTMEVTLQDGRDVFNSSHDTTTHWAICPGEPAGDFPKRKVFAELSHSVIANKCPDQFEFNDIFYNWEVGDEFVIPFANLSSNDLYSLLRKPNDNAVAVGEDPVTVSNVVITSSQVGATWYEDASSDVWEALDEPGFQEMLRYKGLDVSEPIPITEFEEGHCTHPIVQVNTNNEVFIAYECTDPLVHQIHMRSTAAPSTSFPSGILSPKNLDANLDYFLSPGDFTFSTPVTLETEGINQLPDMFIDASDVVHLVWQSNRDNYWEVYYAKSSDSFRPVRITNFESKSLKPSITGDNSGNLHIVWHDDRFGNWEIMMAYRLDDRPLTLAEQDPYLAGVRNDGYTHSTDVIPLVMTNPSNDEVLCISNLFVRFYNDRLLGEQVFDIFQSEFPQAFQIPGADAGDDATVTIAYPQFSDWTESSVMGSTEWLSPLIDTEIGGGRLESFSLTYEATLDLNFIRFTFSPTPTVDDDATYVSPYWDLQFISSGQIVEYDSLSQLTGREDEEVEPVARYIRIQLGGVGVNDISDLSTITLNFTRTERLCITPGETVTGFLDLTPSIRVDGEGNEFVETPIPLDINRNQVYYIAIVGFRDDGQPVAFADPKRSVSCESCVSEEEPWSSATCSVSVPFENVTDSAQRNMFANARVRFYADETELNLVAQFDAFNNGHLEYFTTNYNEPAQSVWQGEGWEIPFGKRRSITLWPLLDNTSGLLCGVPYWVEIETCYGTAESPGERIGLTRESFTKWTCNCGAPRWEERFGDAPANIQDRVHWESSGAGFSDSRLTETGSKVNNYNPKIQIRSDLTGLVLYERNSGDDINQLYATAFSIAPGSNMYATGAEDITSQLVGMLVKSDIPITACAGSNCDDNGPAMEGRNLDFSLDQYDNIFLASELYHDQTKCQDLQKDKQRSITVHRCGVFSRNLVFSSEDEEGGGTFPCGAKEILGKTAPLATDRTYQKIIRMARVTNEYAKYHVVRTKKTAAVVDQCSIEIEIITEPETVAVRLKNENEEWSTWYPFSGQIGANTIRIPWTLSSISGVKNVTIQGATYQGLSASFSVPIIADYKGIDHTISFYKSSNPAAPVPSLGDIVVSELLSVLQSQSAVFTEQNKLNELEGVPVAGIRQPTIDSDNNITQRLREYIFIELAPTTSYLDTLDLDDSASYPTFDVLQQGAEDFFSLPMVYESSNQTFRGVFPIQKDNEAFFKDGLSFVIPHFRNDCSDLSVSLLGTEEYIRDSFNMVIPGTRAVPGETTAEDVWADERDDAGQVKHQLSIRSTEDPYFAFGDPNYRLKKQDE